MDNILNNVSLTNLTTNTTDILIAVKPFLTLLLGILLAFLVIGSIIDFIKQKKN